MRKKLLNLLFLGAALCLATACGDDDNEVYDDGEVPPIIGPIQGELAGHDYVDLGLPSGLKWATCNVGAESPEGYGDYYAWGEVVPKYDYTSDNSLTDGLSEDTLRLKGIIDDVGNLTRDYDAASAKWGGSWRMPTQEEIQELFDKCSWSGTELNGVYGYKMTGPSGGSIFLPAAGYRNGSSLHIAGIYGYYWSTSVYNGLYFYSVYHDWGSYGRNCGQSVRPVSE